MSDGRQWDFAPPSGLPGAGRSRLITGVAAALLVGFVALFSVTVWSSFHQSAQKRLENAVEMTRLIETGVTRTFESAETTLTAAAEESLAAAAMGDFAPLSAQLAERLRFAPHIRQIVIIDGDGRILADTRAGDHPAPHLDVAALALPARGVGGLSNGLRIGRTQPGRYLPLAGEPPEATPVRTILPVVVEAGRDLRVVAALNPMHFRDLLLDAAMGAHGGISLVQFDGSVIIDGGASTAGLDLREAVRAEAEGGILPLPGDGGLFGRFAAYRLSARYPLAVAAGVDHRDSFSGWVQANRQMLFWTGTAVAGLLLGGIALYREVSRRLRLQGEVRLLFEAVEQSVTAIMITDPTGCIVYVNPAFSRLTGFPAEEAVGRNPRFLKSGHTSREEYARLWANLRSGRSWHGEFRNRTRDGGEVWEMATISPVRDAEGTITHFIAAKLDITRLKQSEAEREALIGALGRANRELTRFAEIAAHHLQEPVRRLLVFTDMLARPGQEPDKAAHTAARIRQNAAALRDQLRDIQNYLAAGEPRPDAAAADTTAIARRAATAALTELHDPEARVEVDDMLPPVALDAGRLGLAFGHLIDNGLKYRHDARPPLVRITAQPGPPGRVVLRVEDNGRGIAPQYWTRAADVFERLDADDTIPGTGIGLAIVRRIVESVNGTLRVEASGNLGGTAVLLEVPAREDEHPRSL
ncbi:PAS domain S-box protein [Caenispirillum bisanense]|uniref:sensor histidine kinase n=1 Tax=Caenispirillum bisanense TaxID=414052 RepID=UPI0031DF4004